MCKGRTLPSLTLGALAFGLIAVYSSGASAQGTCASGVTGTSCYHLKGSDTLFDIMTQSILSARAAGIAGANNLAYDGTGSGNAEAQMTAGGTAAGAGYTTANHGVQSIGAMSRNFRPKFVDTLAGGFLGFDSWSPGVPNVVALDAAVFAHKSTVGCANINFPHFTDNAIPTAAVERAVQNNASLPLAFGNAGALNSTSSTINYSNLLMVVLAGVDGSGTIAACSDPRRVQAVNDLTQCLGVAELDHLYRRDDNSGTTDTIRDRLLVTPQSSTAPGSDPTRYPWIGGRFCNGKAIGGIDGSALQLGLCSVTRTQLCKADGSTGAGPPAWGLCPSGETCQFNLNNQDFDPIRRPCVPGDATHAPTTCTDLTTGVACNGLTDPPGTNCTQGLVVALSDTDPGDPVNVTDITTSIAARVKNDANGFSMGYAGREVAGVGRGTKGSTMNSTGFSVANVRSESYFLSRRLFLQNGLVSGQPASAAPNDLASNLNITGQGASQVTAEQNLFTYMTDPNGSLAGGNPGRCIVDPIATRFGFVTCSANCSDDPSTLPGNLCGKLPAPAPYSGLGALFPSATASGGGAIAMPSSGAIANSGSSKCVSTGAAPSGGSCPGAVNRPSHAACSVNSDCASGVCTDGLGLGIAPAGLVCQ